MTLVDRDRIIEATDLPALADEMLGPRRGTSRSPAWPCPSPQHAQTGKSPPVSVFRAQRGDERWHCHGCGLGGTAIDLVMAVKGATVREAIEELAGRVGMRPWDGSVDRPSLSIRRPRADRRPAAGDLAGLQRFVEDCAERLWRPQGRAVLRWLTEERGLPEDVLACNRIGADPGSRGQSRPEGMPAAGRAAVLPVYESGRPVFAQVRSVTPLPDRPRYLNAAGRLAPNPRVAFYDPLEVTGGCVLVTEGVIDALSANAAGFRSAAVLGASLASGGANEAVADRLAKGGEPLVIAFDADDAGNRAGRLLAALLEERGARVWRAYVPIEMNDLNAWMRRSRDWENGLRVAIASVVAVRPPRIAM